MQAKGDLGVWPGEGDYHPCRGEKGSKKRKIPVLASIKSTAVLFVLTPL